MVLFKQSCSPRQLSAGMWALEEAVHPVSGQEPFRAHRSSEGRDPTQPCAPKPSCISQVAVRAPHSVPSCHLTTCPETDTVRHPSSPYTRLPTLG